MSFVTINIFREDFNVARNFGVLYRILSSLVIVILLIGFLFGAPLHFEFSTLIALVFVFGSIYISENYIRKLLPDWPKKKLFVGTITFSENQIVVNSNHNNIELQLSECSEMILFYDHYIGYKATSRDVERNGNCLLFFKNRNADISIFKFNISDENCFEEFNILIDKYKNELPYFKEYLPNEIKHVLKSNYSDRIRY